jgi:predicted CopG family antitoxin
LEPSEAEQDELLHVLNKLRALRGPGESYSDVILRLVEIEAGWRC